MPDLSAFYAYPSTPTQIGETIEAAIEELRQRSGVSSLTSWTETDIAGRFIADEVLQKIAEKDFFIADITELNFNVTYEVGYAIGKRKKLFLTRNNALRKPANELSQLGIFDTLGYKQYENSSQLATLLRTINTATGPVPFQAELNRRAPVYLIEAKYKTDYVIRMLARVKKARLFFRSFDPNEQPRLSAHEAIRSVAQSYGVLVHLVPKSIEDSRIHNLRSAFLAGLADGMGKVLVILQQGDEPVPIDYRDLVKVYYRPEQIDEPVAEFASRVMEAWQAGVEQPKAEAKSLLAKISLGASSAENEFRDLGEYYVETDAYQRALRGDVRIVVGRKGAGKSAIFVQVRDRIRRYKNNVVLDLKPDGYQLLKFKEDILRLLQEGTFEHTVTAFWEYLLLLEVCHKILEKDKIPHTRDSNLYDPYRKLAGTYQSDEYVREGDFSERMSKLIEAISGKYKAKYPGQGEVRLSQAQVTEILYAHDVPKLRDLVADYLQFKDSLWLLFDNLDKGWPTHGLRHEDLIIIRSLVDATRNLERLMRRHKIEAHMLIFLRNDVYELLVQETPDRGKEAQVVLDWTDPDMLREMIRRRLIYSGEIPPTQSFEEMWRSICVSHVAGEESSQYLIDRSLMRPRCLLDIINHCRSYAVNLGHTRIEQEDIQKGLSAYSTDLIFEISLEIRDVCPSAENILYEFIGSSRNTSSDALKETLKAYSLQAEQYQSIIDILLWYGVLGIVRLDGEVVYIHSVNYDINLLKGIRKKLEATGVMYAINPAFWPGLEAGH